MNETEIIAQLRAELDDFKKKLEKENKEQILSGNLNMINLLFYDFVDDDLLYIQSKRCLMIFKKNILSKYDRFLKDYILNHSVGYDTFKFGILEKFCELYNEHIDGFNNGEVLYKYAHRGGLINRSILRYKNEDLYVENSYLGIQNYIPYNSIIYADQPARKIVEGITVGDFIVNKSIEVRRKVYIDMFNYAFNKYAVSNPDFVSGELLDCHVYNFIINDEGFHFIDTDVISEQDISKNMCLAYALNYDDYKYMIDIYNFPDDYQSLVNNHPLKQRNINLENARSKNISLFHKYFSEAGLIAPLTCLDVKYKIGNDIFNYIDKEWYSTQYSDYKNEAKNVIEHYMNIGWRRGNNPSPLFDTNQYLKDYPDIVSAGMNPLEHYILYGKKEGRKATPVK